MMRCPSCPGQLERTRYEGLPVFRCLACLGYLVETRRVTDIKRRRFKPDARLQADALAAHDDNTESIRCPRCRREMAKERSKRPLSFHIDTCHDCSLVWLDLGELARIQLDFEATPRAKDAQRLQKRHQEMTDAERDEFARNLAALPPGDASLLSPFGEALVESLAQMGSRSR